MTRIDTAQEATSSRSEVYAALDKGIGLELWQSSDREERSGCVVSSGEGHCGEPAPQSRSADLGDQTPCPRVRHLSAIERGTRELRAGAEVRRPCLHRNCEIGAKARARHTS